MDKVSTAYNFRHYHLRGGWQNLIYFYLNNGRSCVLKSQPVLSNVLCIITATSWKLGILLAMVSY